MKFNIPAILQDSLFLLPRLARTAIRVGFRQFFFTTSDRLEAFTEPVWLAEQLGLEAHEVESAQIEAVHTGTATRSRLRIHYRDDQKAGSAPASIFIKSRPSDFSSALFGALFQLGGNEVSFYQKLRPDLPIHAPELIYAEGDSANYAMLLQDLADDACDFRDLASRCSLDEATEIVTTLATLHAHFWESKRFHADLAWVNRLETNRDFRLLHLVRELAVPMAFRKYARVLPDEIHDVVPHLMSHYAQLEEAWAQGPRTLVHGDAHLGNMYFLDGRAGLLDWQVAQWGQGMRDIAYFLINSTSTELRRNHQEGLIRHYLDTLGSLGVDLDFETAWEQYRLQSVYAWIAGVVTAPSNFQGEAVVAAGLTRSCKAILDLDAIDLIRAL